MDVQEKLDLVRKVSNLMRESTSYLDIHSRAYNEAIYDVLKILYEKIENKEGK